MTLGELVDRSDEPREIDMTAACDPAEVDKHRRDSPSSKLYHTTSNLEAWLAHASHLGSRTTFHARQAR